MRTTVLARPNLKGILLGAIVLAAVTQWVVSGSSEPLTRKQSGFSLRDASADKYLGSLLEKAANTPDPELYNKISIVYERRGNYRKALFFLRQADRMTDLADN
jgi:hypothetical protein